MTKIDLNKQLINFRINWAKILAFSAFWCYGFYGAISSSKRIGIIGSAFVFFVLFFIFILFLILWQYSRNYRDTIIIKTKDIFVFISFLVVTFIFSLKSLNHSLVGDEIYHSQLSSNLGIPFIRYLTNHTDIFDNFAFLHILRIFNLMLFIAGIVLYWITRRRSILFKIVFYSTAFILCRMIIIKFIGNDDLYPSLRLFPLWLTSTILGFSNFSFRLAHFILLSILMWAVQRITNKKLSFVNSWFVALGIGTIPLLWHISTLVEFSIWTVFACTLFLLIVYDKGDEFSYFRWFSFISILTLMRMPVFVALIPLFLMYIVRNFKQKEFKIKNTILFTLPALAMLPVLSRNILFGTTATYHIPGEYSIIPADASTLQKVWLSVTTGIAPKAIFDSIMFPWIIFFFLAFIPFSLKSIFKKPLTLLLFIIAYYMFYSTRPCTWVVPRHIAEYTIPFVILGFCNLIIKLCHDKNLISKLLPIFLLPLIILNIYRFNNIHKFNKPVDELKFSFLDSSDITKKGIVILSGFPYAYREAFQEVRRSGFAGSTYVSGITYGAFNEIINGFSIREILSTQKIIDEVNSLKTKKQVGWLQSDAEIINNVSGIKLVLISDVAHEDLIFDLQKLGWKKWKFFKDVKYQSTIFGMIRSRE